MSEIKHKTAHVGAQIPRELWRHFAALLKLKEMKQKDFFIDGIKKFVEENKGVIDQNE